MGIYDREYYREESPGRFEMGRNWSATTWLIAINAVVFLANALVGHDHWLMWQLSATPATFIKPYLWWQWLTYGFAHDPSNIGHIFWNMFGLWIFGKPVEGVYGSKEYLKFYLVSVVLGGIFWTARVFSLDADEARAILLGASGAVTAVTLLFCIHFPKHTILLMFVLPVPAWFLGAMIILGNVMGSLSGATGVAFDVHLVGAVFAICYYRFGWNITRWTPSMPSLTGLFKSRPRLRVHHPAESPGSADDLSDQADRLLDKINREGIDSLTPRERQILEKHSRQMRDKRP